MIPLPAVMKAFGCNRNKLNKWREGHLKAEIPDGTPGVSTMVNRETALEIAFMSALTGSGYDPSDARIVAREWLTKNRTKGGLDKIWIYDPIAGMLAHRGSTDFKIEAILNHSREQVEMPLGSQNRPSMALKVFNLGEIISRLDEIEHQYEQIGKL